MTKGAKQKRSDGRQTNNGKPKLDETIALKVTSLNAGGKKKKAGLFYACRRLSLSSSSLHKTIASNLCRCLHYLCVFNNY